MKVKKGKRPGMRMVLREQTSIRTVMRQRIMISSFTIVLVTVSAILYFNFSNKPQANAMPADLIYGVGDGDGYAFSSYGSSGGEKPLPIVLLSFEVRCSNGEVLIKWATASEKNNDFYTIERSQDGRNFSPLKNVAGAGNSSTVRTYNAVDEHPIAIVNYYRLKQTDYDGKFAYASIKSAKCENNQSEEELTVASIGPNPFSDNFTLNYVVINDGIVNVRILNATGAIIRQEVLQAENGNNSYHFVDNNDATPGLYYVMISKGDKVVAKKIIKY